MDANSSNTSLILEALPPTPDGSTDPQSKIASLAAQLKDFADVHQRFHQKLTTITRVALESDAEVPVQQGLGLEEEEEWKEVTTQVTTGVLPAVMPSIEEGVGS